MIRRPWSAVEIELLRSIFPEVCTADVAALLERTEKAVSMAAVTHGLRKSADYLASAASGRAQKGIQHPAVVAARFRRGHSTWNKGVKGSTGTHERCRAHQFKPGAVTGAALANMQPPGTQVLDKDGLLMRKVSQTGNRRVDWRAVHALVWEAENGPIPAGSVCVFRPGHKTSDAAQIRAENVECLTRSELMRRNSVHTKYPPEVARLVQLRGALNRQINKRQSAQEDSHA